MRFSIITVTKHDAAGLARTKASIDSQTYRDFEWVVIDGAVEVDTGIYDAMNKGLTRATGQYVIFMNGGDCFANPHTLETLAQYDADFIYGDAYEDGHLKRARHSIVSRMITHHQAMCYARAAIGDLRYDTQYHIAADYKFTAQFLMRVKSVQYIAVPLCVFEVGGISQRKSRLGRREQHSIRRALALCPTWHAYGIYARQVLAQIVRRFTPLLYWRVKL